MFLVSKIARKVGLRSCGVASSPIVGRVRSLASDKLTAEEIAAVPLTAQQLRNAAEMDAKYRSSHMEVESKMDPEEFDMVRRKRMIYRSKQRGWLEADLLMGSWATEHVPTLTNLELDE